MIRLEQQRDGCCVLNRQSTIGNPSPLVRQDLGHGFDPELLTVAESRGVVTEEAREEQHARGEVHFYGSGKPDLVIGFRATVLVLQAFNLLLIPLKVTEQLLDIRQGPADSIVLLAGDARAHRQERTKKNRDRVEYATIGAATAHRATPLTSIHNPHV
jgi:hypothetical protein